MFWYSWPSWLVEGLGGIALIMILYWALRLITQKRTLSLFPVLMLGLVMSVFYELFWDINGWSLVDVLERWAGMMIGITVAWFLNFPIPKSK